MTGLVDGLGFEELGDASGSAEKPSQLNITGSVTSASQISGLNVFSQGSGTFGRITNGDGALFPIVRNSGTSPTFGARVQVGSSLTGAEGFGSAIFNTEFANTQYFWSAQVGSTGGYLSVDAGSWNVTISGPAGRNVSGVTFKGAPSSPYTWVAIGL